MDRRRFVGGVALGLVVAPLAARAQQAAKVPRIGLLTAGSFASPEFQSGIDGFHQGMRERGYIDGQNIVFEYRSAEGKFEQLPALASELVRLKVDVIVVGSSQGARAVQQATGTIPIVAMVMGNPVEDGLAASLAQPGGNVTGLTYLGAELILKRLELLKDMLPRVSRAAAVWHRDAFGARSMQEVLSETE